MRNKLSSKLSENYTVEVETAKNPRMKIININNNMSAAELKDDINKRNFSNLDESCKVISTFK